MAGPRQSVPTSGAGNRACLGSTETLSGRVVDPVHLAIAGARITAVRNNQTPTGPPFPGQNGEFSLPAGSRDLHITLLRKDSRMPSDGYDSRTSPDALEFVLQVSAVNIRVTIRSRAGIRRQPSAAGQRLNAVSDVPQSITVLTHEQIGDQMNDGIGDVVQYIPGITSIQGENNRDQIGTGNSTSADFFLNGTRDDVRISRSVQSGTGEALKGPNADDFGRRRRWRRHQSGNQERNLPDT